MGYSPWGCKESDTSEQLLALWASLGAQMLRPALCTGFPSGSDGKASACNAGDLGLSVGWEDPLEKENGNPLQYSCLENSLDGGAWLATVQGSQRVGLD